MPTKVRLVKAMVFPVVMYGYESWTVKKAEHRRINAFELWCWRRLLRVPLTARRSNQSILKEITPGCSLEGLMLKLKLQYFFLLSMIFLFSLLFLQAKKNQVIQIHKIINRVTDPSPFQIAICDDYF